MSKHNPEITDVFCCVLLGYNTTKKITKILNQPQATVSKKLDFMESWGMLNKRGCEYSVIWPLVYLKIRDIIKNKVEEDFYACPSKDLDEALTGKGSLPYQKRTRRLYSILKNLENYFPDTLIKRILEAYAHYFLDLIGTKHSVRLSFVSIVDWFYCGLGRMDRGEVKNKILLAIKDGITVPPSEEEAFVYFLMDDS